LAWEETIDGLEVVDPIGHPDSSRFILLPAGSPLQLPACSFISRSSDEPWMIWTGLEIDEGAVYIGKGDFHEMSRVAGYVPESAISRAQKDNERLQNDLVIAIGTINSLRNAIADLVGTQPIIQVAIEPSRIDESSGDDEDRGAEGGKTSVIVDLELDD
jgi:hypothetical protein